MSYARNLLSRGEEVVHESRQHWFAVLGRMWLWILIAVVALAVLLMVGTNAEPVLGPAVDTALTVAALVAFLASLGYAGLVVWDWRNQEWLVTTRRVIRAEGILNKSMSDSSLEKINDARLTQSFIGRIFNYGTLDILTAAEEAGGGNVDDFPMLADPVEFKVAMLNQKELLERPDLAPPRYQRQAPPPEMQRAPPMPPRAGSDRVAQVASAPEAAMAGAAGGGQAGTDVVAPAPAAATNGGADAAPPRSAADELAATLERLAALRDKGLITAEEYDAKKRELLERM